MSLSQGNRRTCRWVLRGTLPSDQKEEVQMKSMSAFHTAAAKAEKARAEALRNERDRASSFLDELDDVLSESSVEPPTD